MSTGRHLKFGVFASAALALTCSAQAQVVVGYYTDGNPAATGWATPITDNGFTPIQVLDIALFDFTTVDIMVIDNAANGDPSAALLGRSGDLVTYVTGGGKVVIHDRGVINNTWIPGGGGMNLFRDFTFDADLQVVIDTTKVTDGPFGTIDDTTLDGGNSSNHGWATRVPVGTKTILSAGTDPARAAAFSYQLGAGSVYYSTIPLDFYLAGAGVDPPATAMRTIYAPNVLAHMNQKKGCAEDFNGDGIVSTADLLQLLSAWGRCP